MNTGSAPNTRQVVMEHATVIARWVVGVLFVYMGLKKGMDPVAFLKLIRQYDLALAPVVLNSIAATLPWFEVVCGLLLLAGVAVRGTAVMLLGMLVPFTIVVWQRAVALQAEMAIPFCSLRFDCGCGAGEVLICAKIAENIGLILVCGLLVTGYGRRWSARYSLSACCSGGDEVVAAAETR
jgi:uncharacterized membrane protein YphA (DoxX/SURF4 family)